MAADMHAGAVRCGLRPCGLLVGSASGYGRRSLRPRPTADLPPSGACQQGRHLRQTTSLRAAGALPQPLQPQHLLRSVLSCPAAAAPPAAQEQAEQLPKAFDAQESQQRLYRWCAGWVPVHVKLL